MSDLRVPMDVVMSAFGVDATVTRPFPGDTPIETQIAWVTPLNDEVPFGSDLQRKSRRRVASLSRDEVPTAPKGTVIVAPERAGEDDQTWRVVDVELEDADHIRVLVVRDEREAS